MAVAVWRRSQQSHDASFLSVILVFMIGQVDVIGNEGQLVTLSLEHALTPGNFKPRGQISYRNPNSLLTSVNKISSTIKFSQTELSKEDKAKIRDLLNKDEHYQIRVRLPYSSKLAYVTASVPACTLVASNFVDLIKLNLDQFGDIISIEYHTKVSSCTAMKDTSAWDSLDKMETTIRLGFGVEGARPLREAILSPEQAKQDEESKKGWFAKYWYFLIPVVIMFVISGLTGATEPAEASGQGSDAAPAGGRTRGTR